MLENPSRIHSMTAVVDALATGCSNLLDKLEEGEIDIRNYKLVVGSSSAEMATVAQINTNKLSSIASAHTHVDAQTESSKITIEQTDPIISTTSNEAGLIQHSAHANVHVDAPLDIFFSRMEHAAPVLLQNVDAPLVFPSTCSTSNIATGNVLLSMTVTSNYSFDDRVHSPSSELVSL